MILYDFLSGAVVLGFFVCCLFFVRFWRRTREQLFLAFALAFALLGLGQTVIALAAGTSLSEHENPGEATVHVLSGRVRLLADGDSWDGREGDLIVIPPARHSLQAVDNAVVPLTVAKHD